MAEYKVWQTMKYATAKKKEVLDAALVSDNYCIQLKKDGSSYTLAKDLDGSVHLYGDKISKKDGKVIDKIENVPHMKEFAEEVFPCGSQIVLEVCYGDSSTSVNTIMLALPAKAIARQNENGLATGYVFDILYWDNESYYDKDFGERWNKVVELFDSWQEIGIPKWLEMAETHFENKGEMITKWLAAGEEGGVLKMLKSQGRTSAAHAVRELGATAGRPMNTTFKIKQVDTADVVIMGIEMPNKAYQGKDPENYPYRDEDDNPVNRLWKLGYANAFVIGAYDNNELIKIGTVASGLDDNLREHMAESPEDYIGQVIEIDCMSKDKEARSFRHPRLMRFRPDKLAEQCLMKEIFV